MNRIERGSYLAAIGLLLVAVIALHLQNQRFQAPSGAAGSGPGTTNTTGGAR